MTRSGREPALPGDEVEGQTGAAVGRQLLQALQVGEKSQEQVEIGRRQAEERVDHLDARPLVAMLVRVRKAARVVQRIAHLQVVQGVVPGKIGVARMLAKPHGVKFQRAEGRPDEVEARVGRAVEFRRRRLRGHARNATPAPLGQQSRREHSMCSSGW